MYKERMEYTIPVQIMNGKTAMQTKKSFFLFIIYAPFPRCRPQ